MSKKIKEFFRIIFKIHDNLCDGCAQVSAWMMFGMALIISYEVIVRYFFNSPTIWAVDFSDYIMLYSTFLVSAWLLKKEGHVRLTLLLEHLSQKSKLILDIINSIIGAGVCAFIFWYGIGDIIDSIEREIVLPRPLPVPKYLILAAIPFGCLILFFQFIKNTFILIKNLKTFSKQIKINLPKK